MLENLHAAQLSAILADESCDILACMDTRDRRAFRNLLLELILNNDAAQHFTVL